MRFNASGLPENPAKDAYSAELGIEGRVRVSPNPNPNPNPSPNPYPNLNLTLPYTVSFLCFGSVCSCFWRYIAGKKTAAGEMKK